MTSPLLIATREPIDARWFSALERTAKYSLEMYAWIAPPLTRQAIAFQQFQQTGFSEAPSLRPDNAHQSDVQAERRRLQALVEQIDAQEADLLVRTAYLKHLCELITHADLYLAVLDGDADKVAKLNEALYGRPDRGIFSAVCRWYRNWAEEIMERDPEQARLAQKILDVLPRPADTPAALGPAGPVFADQRQRHMGVQGFYRQLFAGQELPTGQVGQIAGDKLVRQLLKNLESRYSIQDTPDGFWGVRHGSKCIVRPAGYLLDAEQFLGVVGHEVGSHLLERLNGQRQPLSLLSLGLCGYERGGEGRALLREQVVYPTWEQFSRQDRWHTILLRHLAISLAVGLDGIPRGLVEVYASINAIDKLRVALQNPGISPGIGLEMQAHSQTWQLVSRVLGGTDGTGGAYYKDIVYLEGNARCWRKLAERPDLMRLGDMGKVDIANPEHVNILAELTLK